MQKLRIELEMILELQIEQLKLELEIISEFKQQLRPEL